jgi:hypothetical protein
MTMRLSKSSSLLKPLAQESCVEIDFRRSHYKQAPSEVQPLNEQYSDSENFLNGLEKSLTNEFRCKEDRDIHEVLMSDQMV